MSRRSTRYKRQVRQYLGKHGVKDAGEVTGRVGSHNTERKGKLMLQWAKAAGAK